MPTKCITSTLTSELCCKLRVGPIFTMLFSFTSFEKAWQSIVSNYLVANLFPTLRECFRFLTMRSNVSVIISSQIHYSVCLLSAAMYLLSIKHYYSYVHTSFIHRFCTGSCVQIYYLLPMLECWWQNT